MSIKVQSPRKNSGRVPADKMSTLARCTNDTRDVHGLRASTRRYSCQSLPRPILFAHRLKDNLSGGSVAIYETDVLPNSETENRPRQLIEEAAGKRVTALINQLRRSLLIRLKTIWRLRISVYPRRLWDPEVVVTLWPVLLELYSLFFPLQIQLSPS